VSGHRVVMTVLWVREAVGVAAGAKRSRDARGCLLGYMQEVSNRLPGACCVWWVHVHVKPEAVC
jgi:hypothetical protein